MMDDMAEAKRIAAGLSKAQREAMTKYKESPGVPLGSDRTIAALVSKGLVDEFEPFADIDPGLNQRMRSMGVAFVVNYFTRFGLAVRAALPADPSTRERGE